MPFYDGMYFSNEAEYREYLLWKKLEEEGKLPTLTARIRDYFSKIRPPEEVTEMSWAEKVGYALFNKVSDFFSIMWDKVWVNFRKALSGIFEDTTKLFFKIAVTSATPGVKEYFFEWMKQAQLPAELEDSIKARLNIGTPIDYLAVFFFCVLSFVFRALGILSGGMEVARQKAFSLITPSVPEITALLSARFRKPEYETILNDYRRRMGYDDTAWDMFKLISYALLSPDQIRDSYLRGEIDKTTLFKKLRESGFREEEFELIEKLFYFIPNPADLVRFAVREAFTPEIAEKFGQYQDLPLEFVKWAEKQGMSEFWSKCFWAAHWDLPPVTQGYEMLHRRIIDEETLKLLMRALDIMPFWRDKLIKLSYYPYTRVDVRRMYGAGVLNKQDVYNTYRDLGYDDEHAKNLTAFTIIDAMTEEKNLSKTDIISSYERKIISREEAKSLLNSLGYSGDESEVYLAKSDYDTFKKYKDKQLSAIKRLYISGLIDETEARGRLGKLNLSGKEMEELFNDWDLEREEKEPELTTTQLQNLFLTRIIDEKTFREKLEAKNYSDENIDYLVKLTLKGKVGG